MPKYWFVRSPYKSRTWQDVLMKDVLKLYGIRSHAAKSNIAQMQKEDKVLWYSSSQGKKVFGVMKVSSNPYTDTTSSNGWLAIDFKPVKTFAYAITLVELNNMFNETPNFLKQQRVSVTQLSKTEFETIVQYHKKRNLV